MPSSVLGGCLLRCARRTSPPSTSARLASFAPSTSAALARSSRPYSTSSAVRSTWNTSRRHFSAPPPSGPPPPQPLPTGDRPPPLTREQYQREQLLRAKELQDRYYKKNKHQAANIGLYMTAVVLVMTGMSYAAVPLYRAFCGATGFAGIPMTEKSRMDPTKLVPTSSERRITVHFNAATSDVLPWKFKPAQTTVTVRPGETALAFYTAENYGKDDIVGISTYNVVPGKIAPYFAKVECFCFEEQRILAGEELDLPVFFFLDRDLLDDPQMDDVDDVVLNYTFFKARRNTQGHYQPDADKAVVDKASGWEEYEHAPMVEDRGAVPSALPKPSKV